MIRRMFAILLPIKWVGATLRWIAFSVGLNQLPLINRILFRTFIRKLEAQFHIMLTGDMAPDKFVRSHYMAKLEVMTILDQFYIPCPNEKDDTVTIWLQFLALLIPECRSGNLDRAKELMSDPNLKFHDYVLVSRTKQLSYTA
ncbi:MAG: hypothetical protein OXE86_18685 [Alphaproteobacteria bacterium]|nr:hypothetical protein [Alphaproteobacteria bacterium]